MKLTTRRVLIISFLTGLFIRVAIELLSPYPVGVDVPTYAYQLELYLKKMDWDLFYLASPLVYFIAVPLKLLTSLDSLTVWKFISPLLNGLVGLSFSFMLLQGFKWQPKKALFGTVFFLSYFVQIIISNGMLAQQLGSAFLFMALAYYMSGDYNKASLMSIFVSLSHQLTPVLLLAIISLDMLRKVYHKQEVKGNLKIIFSSIISFFIILFILPSLSSPDPITEITIYIRSFVFGGGYAGVAPIITSTPEWLQMTNHFLIYCGMLVISATIGYYDNKVLTIWTGLELILCFVPLGWTWKRWQWLLAQPLTIYSVNALYANNNKKLLKYLKYIFLIVIICHSTLYSISPYTIARSSIYFDEIPYLEQTHDFLKVRTTDNSLIIASNELFRFYQLLALRDGRSPMVIRITTLLREGDNLYIYISSVRGLDFYFFREVEVKVDVTKYDSVYMLVDHWDEVYLLDSIDLFKEVKTIGGITIYELDR